MLEDVWWLLLFVQVLIDVILLVKVFVARLDFFLHWVTETIPVTRIRTVTSVRGSNSYQLLHVQIQHRRSSLCPVSRWRTCEYLSFSAGPAGDDRARGGHVAVCQYLAHLQLLLIHVFTRPRSGSL